MSAATTRARAAALPTALLAALALAGCPAPGWRPTVPGNAGAPSSPALPIARAPGTFPSATGCSIDAMLYRPSRPRTDGLAVLAPGFLRDRRHLDGLAQALAGRGIPTVALTPCTSRPWAGRQVQTGADMGRVARALHARRVVYGGFSSGALSALVAARLDREAVGVLALDLVDRDGLGVGMARGLDPPLIGLHGEPGRCNADNNGLAVFAAAPRSRVAPIPGATHCDFESPTDWLCEALCPAGDSRSMERRREVVARSVAAVEDLLRIGRGPVPPAARLARTSDAAASGDKSAQGAPPKQAARGPRRPGPAGGDRPSASAPRFLGRRPWSSAADRPRATDVTIAH